MSLCFHFFWSPYDLTMKQWYDLLLRVILLKTYSYPGYRGKNSMHSLPESSCFCFALCFILSITPPSDILTAPEGYCYMSSNCSKIWFAPALKIHNVYTKHVHHLIHGELLFFRYILREKHPQNVWVQCCFHKGQIYDKRSTNFQYQYDTCSLMTKCDVTTAPFWFEDAFVIDTSPQL